MALVPTLDEARAELARRNLSEYIKQAWHLVEPTTQYTHGWHIDAICEHLEAVAQGHIRDLVITMPPRHMKSLAVSVFWPTWMWIDNPEVRFLYSSYASQLSVRDSVKCRRIIESEWFQMRFGDKFQLVGDQNVKSRFENNRTGYRLATSVGGSATGEGGDYVVVDDPHNVSDVPSDTMRGHVLDWWDQVMSTRLNDPRKGARIMVMQRIHEGDLAGHVLETRNPVHLCLPARYEPQHPFVWPDDPRTEEGELLWPERWDKDDLDRQAVILGSYGFAGQYQQRPAPAEGGLLKAEWWRFYQPWKDGYPQFQEIIQSWDMAFKDTKHSDYVVGQVWGRDLANKYLIYQTRARLDFPATVAAVRAQADWVQENFPNLAGGHTILVEEAANGSAVIQALKRELSSVLGYSPDRSKEARASAVSPQIEAGNVFLPGDRTAEGAIDRAQTPLWVQDFIDESTAFPNAMHDDQVDAMTQALIRMADRTGRAARTTPVEPLVTYAEL